MESLSFLELGLFQDFMTAFTDVINIFLAARVPSEISTIMVSGKLVPLLRNDGGIRPVVVGEVFRRLLSKLCVANVHVSSLQYLKYLQPLQLGVGVKGGTEAVLHSFNRIIRQENMEDESTKVLALIDFENAFNGIFRQVILDIVLHKFPSIYPWVAFCYSVSSPLFVFRSLFTLILVFNNEIL